MRVVARLRTIAVFCLAAVQNPAAVGRLLRNSERLRVDRLDRVFAVGLLTATLFTGCVAGSLHYVGSQRKAAFAAHADLVQATYVAGCGSKLRVKYRPPDSDPVVATVVSGYICPYRARTAEPSIAVLVDRTNKQEAHINSLEFFLPSYGQDVFDWSLVIAGFGAIGLIAFALLQIRDWITGRRGPEPRGSVEDHLSA